MEIAFFRQEQLESVVDLLHEMSLHYNRDNASSRDVVKANLIGNILGPDSGVRLVIASEASRAVGLAAISLLYPAPKEPGAAIHEGAVRGIRQAGRGGRTCAYALDSKVRRNQELLPARLDG